jgi:metallo-beta-lactamase class B
MISASSMLVSLWAAVATAAQPGLETDPPKQCDSCAEWNAPREPFKIYGNTYYVGVAGLSAVLITSSQGLILLDGGLPQSAPLIDANIRKLGFRTEDVKLIVNSHAHYDHAGGIAALQRASGARVAASAAGARALEQGQPTVDDAQFAFGPEPNGFPAVKAVQVVKDGESLALGELAITAHLTPGHTPGSTTWTWRSCEGARCLDVVYADSLTAVSAPGFRFGGDATRESREQSFRKTIAKVAALPCDIVISTHPSATGLEEKLERRAKQARVNPFVDADSCRAYAADATRRFDARLKQEAMDTTKPAAPKP